jgi:MATE family multidrug resistance protein
LIGFVFDYGAPGVWVGYTLGIALAAVALPVRFWRKTAPH